MLNCETVFKTDRPLDFVPAGSILKYRVSSHDEVGQKFDFTNSQLRFRPNRFVAGVIYGGELYALSCLRIWKM